MYTSDIDWAVDNLNTDVGEQRTLRSSSLVPRPCPAFHRFQYSKTEKEKGPGESDSELGGPGNKARDAAQIY